MPSAPQKVGVPTPTKKVCTVQRAFFLIKRTFHQLEVEETENNVEDVQPAEVHPEKDEVLKPAVEMPEQQGVCRHICRLCRLEE